jgi:hydrogenase maturation protease
MPTTGNPGSLLVLGLGNVLCGDDGLGVAAIEMLRSGYRVPDGVRVLDGGTLGLGLLSYIRPFDDVILVDAIEGAGPPGTFIRLEGDEVGPAVQTRLSCHQIGVAELLDALHMLNAYPRSLSLLGLVPATLELGLGRSPPVEAQLPKLVEEIVAEARRFGYGLLRVDAPGNSSAEVRSPGVRALGL